MFIFIFVASFLQVLAVRLEAADFSTVVAQSVQSAHGATTKLLSEKCDPECAKDEECIQLIDDSYTCVKAANLGGLETESESEWERDEINNPKMAIVVAPVPPVGYDEDAFLQWYDGLTQAEKDAFSTSFTQTQSNNDPAKLAAANLKYYGMWYNAYQYMDDKFADESEKNDLALSFVVAGLALACPHGHLAVSAAGALVSAAKTTLDRYKDQRQNLRGKARYMSSAQIAQEVTYTTTKKLAIGLTASYAATEVSAELAGHAARYLQSAATDSAKMATKIALKVAVRTGERGGKEALAESLKKSAGDVADSTGKGEAIGEVYDVLGTCAQNVGELIHDLRQEGVDLLAG